MFSSSRRFHRNILSTADQAEKQVGKPRKSVSGWLRLVGFMVNLAGQLDQRWASARLSNLWFSVFKPRSRHWVQRFWASADASSELHLADRMIPVYFWGQGPLVVCLHGWGGSGTQFRAILPRLVAQGYRVALFDAPAHGYNPGRSTNLLEFAQCLLALQHQVGPIDTVIAHSFGGLGTLTASWQGLTSRRMILIAPGLDVSELFESFCDALSISDKLRNVFRRDVGEMMARIVRENDAWQFFTPESLLPYAAREGLLIYDDHDEEVSAEMLQRTRQMWIGAETYHSTGLGHYRILKDDQVAEKISNWLGVAPAVSRRSSA